MGKGHDSGKGNDDIDDDKREEKRAHLLNLRFGILA
jgi:hypothetical protein